MRILRNGGVGSGPSHCVAVWSVGRIICDPPVRRAPVREAALMFGSRINASRLRVDYPVLPVGGTPSMVRYR